MSRIRSLTLALLAALAALAASSAQASASATQEAILMDDSEFVYAPADRVDKRMAEAKALGFDRIRVSVYWNVLAPEPNSKQRPATADQADDPRFYGQGKWDRYDRIVALAAKHRLGVLFSITGPSPLWVTGTPEQGRSEVEKTWNPNSDDFRKFVTAVGRRYSGSWQDEHEEPAVLPLLPPVKVKSPPIPRVDHWSVWNEPNHGGWLTPQWQAPRAGAALVPASPRIYRGLVDAAWSALASTGHGSDSILIGETAPRGLSPGLTRGLHPLRFVRELYCLDSKFRPYTGAAAEARACPPAFDAAKFAAAHPGLFGAPGFAHHPYSLTAAPAVVEKNRDDVTLSGLRRLTRTLDRAFARYGQKGRLPIWMTEYGYQTNPPDPTIGVPFGRQADWLGQATYLAFRNRRVASFAQFLLLDDGPVRAYPPDDPRYWGTFQTGLVTAQGKRKPAYEAFKRPIAVSPARVRAGRDVRVFGQARSAAGARPGAEIQFRPRGAKRWRTVGHAAGNARGFALTKVPVRRSGSIRIVWTGGAASRAVAVRVVRRS